MRYGCLPTGQGGEEAVTENALIQVLPDVPASVLHTRLQAAPPCAAGPDGIARAGVTAALTATLAAPSAQVKALETQIAGQLADHPDGHIFTSLPRVGTVRAARLLAETGDCRSQIKSISGLDGDGHLERDGWRVARQYGRSIPRVGRRCITAAL